MLFRQLFDPRSSTYTYLLADPATRDALLLDTVFEQFQRDSALVAELGLRLRFTLETHVHADHITAAWLFRERLGSKIALSVDGGADGADLLLQHGDVVSAGGVTLEVRSTPGHTNGCLTYVTGDRQMAFTGDALLIRAAGRTDFQQGDARTLYRSVRGQIFSLPDSCTLYPGHDYQGRTATSVDEERRHNPRLGGLRSEDDFVGYMQNLGLPHPKQIDVAVPANLRCGRPDAGLLPPESPSWAPVVRSFAGVPQIGPHWLEENRANVLVLDVREPAEFDGELGHIDGATLVPIGQLRARLAEIPRDRPVVCVCRSGGRSAQAAIIIEGAGVKDVANLDGGMIAWRTLEREVPGTPVEPV